MRISVTLLALLMASPLAAAPDTTCVRYGKSVKVDDLKITFTELAQDSRCPRTVQCIWAGVAEIRVLVAKGSKSEPLLLSTMSPKNKASAFGHTIELVDLQPYPEEPGEHDPNAYRAKLAVTPEN